MKVLFVCLGNICRSPRPRACCATSCVRQGWMIAYRWIPPALVIGTSARRRTVAPVRPRCAVVMYLSAQRARQVEAADFQRFDLILAMDQSNLRNLKALRPTDARADLDLYLRRYELALDEVPDPYYGGEDGFEQVLDLIEQASDALLVEIKGRL